VTPDDREPWELADDAGRPGKEVPPTSEPIEEEERGDAEATTQSNGNGNPSWNEGDSSVEKEEHAPQYADDDAEEHSDPKGPAGGAGGPR
jgi:hypothetical protein